MKSRQSSIASFVVTALIFTIFLMVVIPWLQEKGPAIDSEFLKLTGTAEEKPYEICKLGPDCIGVIVKPVHKSNIGKGADIYNPITSIFKAIEELQIKYRIKGIAPIIGGTVDGSSTPAIILVVEELS